LPSPLEEFEEYLRKLNSTQIGRRSFLAMAPLLMVACATSHRNLEGDNTGQVPELTVEEEEIMAQEVLPEMQRDYPPVPNQDLQLYVNSLGTKIVRANHLENHPYHFSFTVVGVNQVNAFALPAGTIFVTAPLIATAESEAELAGVLGHEIGHVKARHAAERIAKQRREAGNSWLFGAGGGLLGAVAGFGIGKLVCAKNDSKCLVAATSLGAAAGVGGGLLVQKYVFMANSREDELEADRIGFRTAVGTGYHKEHVGDFYAKLLKVEQEHKKSKIPIISALSDAMNTHPPSAERVKQMHEMSSQTANPLHAVTSTKKFDRIRKIAQKWVADNQPQG
jgi:predicted Zn-dependent protease